MRVLVLGTNYVPEKTAVAPFATGLCEHLVSQGHEVEIVTAFPYYPEWRIWDDYRGHLHLKERIRNVNLRRVWHYVPSQGSNLLQRLAHDLSFTLSAFLAGLFAGRSDLICCVCPPPTLAFTAYLLAKLRRNPYVIVLTDLASDAAVATGIMKDGLFVRMARSLEGFVYRKSDRIVCICHGFVERLTARGVAPSKLCLIPLWGDTERIYPIAGATRFRVENQLQGEDFLVMHTGNMGKKQDLLNVVRAAELSQDVPNLTWLLVGGGEDRSALEEAITHSKLRNIRLLPLQPAEGLAEMYSAADVLLLNQRAAIVDSVIPSKLLTYMAAGRPVLAAVNNKSETARYVERAECGLIVPPQDPKALVDAALSLRRNLALRERYGANGRAHAEQHFTREKVLREYDLLFGRYINEDVTDHQAPKKAVVTN
jgi:colanic acid biosynthesis glycosyl transferase WcaI